MNLGMLRVLLVAASMGLCLADFCTEHGPTSPCWPCDSDIGELQESLKTDLLWHPGPQYGHDMTIPYFNKSYVKNWRFVTSPAYVLQPSKVDDVVEAVKFGKKFGIRLSVLSSGHDYIGRSTGLMTIMIRLDKFKSYTIFPEDANSESGASMIAETGCNWGEIYKAVDGHGLVAIGGAAHGVAMGGWHLGGGHSPITRTYGLGVDQVLSFKVILPDARIANVSANGIEYENGDAASSDTDLFWALRGGGGLAYGIVIQFHFKLYPAPEDGLVGLTMSFPWFIEETGTKENGSIVLNKFHNFLANNLTRNWGGYVIVSNAKVPILFWTLRGTISIYLIHVGGYQQAMASIQPLIDELDHLRYQSDDGLKIKNYTTFWQYSKENKDDLGFRTYIMNRLVQRDDLLGGGITDAIKTHYEERPELKPVDVVQCTYVLIGGKASDVGATATSVNPAFRTGFVSLSCGKGWTEESDDDDYMEDMKEFGEKFYEFGTGTYMNEPDSELENWKNEHWGSNYAQLLSIKQKYDPQMYLNCPHCVGSDIDYTGDLTLDDNCPKSLSSSSNIILASIQIIALATIIQFVKLLID